jgi:BirA family transcriptional regulator, biotin operon repressor / biotin---[acetyl-CoA-carboxylase] ligase
LHKGSPPPPRIGEKLVYLEETPSTNAFLWKLVEQGASNGQAVQAAFQYQGKGQAGASWESEAGANLLLSFYLKTHFLPASEQFKLNMAIALGVSDFGRLYLGPQVQLKWPNDLFYKHKKWGGILIENTIQGNYLCDSVVGIGLNINQSYFPNHLPQAASFFTITGHYYKLEDLRQQLFDRVQKRLDELLAGGFGQQRQEYRQRLLGIEESRMFEFQGQLLRATIVDVDDEGRLVLEGPMGRMRMNNKEIKFRFDG